MRFALTLCAALALTSVASAQDKTPSPRRMLFVQVAEYAYLNPLTHGAPGGTDRTRDSATRLAAGLRIPNAKDNDQLFVLSDTIGTDARLPTKDAIAKVLTDFCATTRAQDRIVIYFGVHAIEKDGKAFVIPIDGDPSASATLMPVADVYAKLKEQKASQRVVIWDVCRANPERVRGRRDAGAMTAALIKALTTAPEGVQVLVSCSGGEHSTESFVARGATGLPGSLYLEALRQAATDDRTANPKAAPGDEIPVEALHKGATKLLSAMVSGQTPVLAGKPVPRPTAYDPKEAPAKRFDLPAAPKVSAEVKAIFDELAVPPLVGDDAALAKLPFSDAALKGYAADVSVEDILKNAEKYPLRAATLRAFQTVRNRGRLDGKERTALATVNSPVTNMTKQAVKKAQEVVAVATIELELEVALLEGVADKRAGETKRWQAHYDYALAELRLWLVVLSEYNRTLGHVATEALPDLIKGGAGWRLAPTAKLEGKKDVKALFTAADEGFAKLAVDHKGTPWEVMANRSRALLPGTRWEPLPPPVK